MENLWFIITFIITSLIDFYITSKYMNFFLGKLKVSINKAEIVYSFSFVISLIQYINVPIPVINTIVSVFWLCLVARCYESKKQKILMVVFLVFMFQFACELIVALVTGGGNTHMTTSGYYAQSYQFVSLSIAQVIIYFLLTSFKNINSKLQLPVTFNITIITLNCLLFYMDMMIFMRENMDLKIKMVSVACTSVMLILIMYLYDIISRGYVNMIQARIMERENMYYIKQAESLQKYNDSTRKFRHDINNHLYVLKSILDDENSNKQAKEYLEQMLGKMNRVKIYSASGNLQIDSIINYKLSDAFDKNIAITSDVKLPNEVKFDMGDIVTILGNILDNAIEATEKLPEKRYIDLNIKYINGVVFIILKNSYKGEIKEKNGVLKTLKKNKLEHGIGLRSVEEVVKKYDGEIKIDYDDKEFCVKIVLYHFYDNVNNTLDFSHGINQI